MAPLIHPSAISLQCENILHTITYNFRFHTNLLYLIVSKIQQIQHGGCRLTDTEIFILWTFEDLSYDVYSELSTYREQNKFLDSKCQKCYLKYKMASLFQAILQKSYPKITGIYFRKTICHKCEFLFDQNRTLSFQSYY